MVLKVMMMAILTRMSITDNYGIKSNENGDINTNTYNKDKIKVLKVKIMVI